MQKKKRFWSPLHRQHFNFYLAYTEFIVPSQRKQQQPADEAFWSWTHAD